MINPLIYVFLTSEPGPNMSLCCAHLSVDLPRRFVKEIAQQTITKPRHNLFDIWEHYFVSWCSFSCLHPMRWQIRWFLVDQSEDRRCSVALLNSQLIYFATSFIYLLVISKPCFWHSEFWIHNLELSTDEKLIPNHVKHSKLLYFTYFGLREFREYLSVATLYKYWDCCENFFPSKLKCQTNPWYVIIHWIF